MVVVELRDRARIEAFLRRDSAAHVYALADLDAPFWPDTRWLAGLEGDEVVALVLLLQGLAMPIVYAICPRDHEPTARLLARVAPELPDRFFYNLGPGLAARLQPGFSIASAGTYWKMRFVAPASHAHAAVDAGIVRLGPEDLEELRAFLDRDAYLAHETGGLFFEPRMLASGGYRGLREGGALVAVAGLHVHSSRYGVAAVGNVVTRPAARGRGLARRVSAAVLEALGPEIETVGLNVHEQNEPALRCYRGLGFEPVCPYEEGVATRSGRSD